jgi:hypothetical protein
MYSSIFLRSCLYHLYSCVTLCCCVFIFCTNILHCLHVLIFYTNIIDMSLVHFIRIFFVDIFCIHCFCNLVDLLNIKINSVHFHSVQSRYFIHSEMQVLLAFSFIYMRFCQGMCIGYWQVVSNHHKLYVHSSNTACVCVGLLIMFLQLIIS